MCVCVCTVCVYVFVREAQGTSVPSQAYTLVSYIVGSSSSCHPRPPLCLCNASPVRCRHCRTSRVPGTPRPRPLRSRSYPSQILPGQLYLGDWEHAADNERLAEMGIRRCGSAGGREGRFGRERGKEGGRAGWGGGIGEGELEG